MINPQKLQALIDEIQREFLISNNVINRTEYPYYHNHPSVPETLTKFKKRLYTYREQCSQLIAKQAELPFTNAPYNNRNFSIETFAHKVTVGLAVSQLGIGDCGECTAKLGLALIQAGFVNLAFIGVRFCNAKEGMEQYHAFIVANLPSLALPSNHNKLSVYDLFKALPSQALIGDAFLGLSFSPTQVPDSFIRYLNAYGGESEIIEYSHFHHVPADSKIFGGYQGIADRVAKELRLRQPLLDEDSYSVKDKLKVEDTTIIKLLKEKSNLHFFGIRDQAYKVDAIVEINTQEESAAATHLQHVLKGHGQFFGSKNKQQLFVLEGVNLSAENPKLIQQIQALAFVK